jgi:predicted metal-binding membrane protein
MKHGAYCVGCCWALIALLFFSGVTNVVWVAALSIIILVEKLVSSTSIAYCMAGLLIAAGFGLLAMEYPLLY